MKLQDLLKVKGELYPSVIISAPRFSGKTYLTKMLLKELVKEYDAIFIFRGSPDKSFESLDKYKNVIIEDYEEEKLENLIENIKTSLENGIENNILVVLDDCLEHFGNKKKSILTKLPVLGRHLKISFMYLLQKYNSCNPTIRNNCLTKIFFRPINNKEMKLICEEQEFVGCDSDKLNDIILNHTGQYKYIVMNDKQDGRALYEGKDLDIKEIEI